MNQILPVPPELQFLIEKRESGERRQIDRRHLQERRGQCPVPAHTAQGTVTERRKGSDQRSGKDQRRRLRRQNDSQPNPMPSPSLDVSTIGLYHASQLAPATNKYSV